MSIVVIYKLNCTGINYFPSNIISLIMVNVIDV